MLGEYHFTYTTPTGTAHGLYVGVHVDPETDAREHVFVLSQIARAIGYSEKSAANLKPACNPRYVRKTVISERPVRTVTRSGLFTATPRSDTTDSDHFHDWARLVMLPILDLQEHANLAGIARYEVMWLRKEIRKLSERLHAAEDLIRIDERASAPPPETESRPSGFPTDLDSFLTVQGAKHAAPEN